MSTSSASSSKRARASGGGRSDDGGRDVELGAVRLGAHRVVRHLRALRERLEQLVGRRPFGRRAPTRGSDVEKEAHPRRELEEELPVFDDVARPLEDGRGVLRERLGEEVLVPARVVGSLERMVGAIT